MLLSNFSLIDQWKKPVDWSAMNPVPKVLVFSGDEASKEAEAWGDYLNVTFNPGYVANPEHLQKVNEKEKLKVVGVISLPHVPLFFKGMVYGGVKRKSPQMAMALDFDSKISAAYGYERKDPVPLIAVLGKNKEEESIQIFRGKFDDEKVKKDILVAIKKQL